MAAIDNTGRPGYMYDEDTDTWYAISGKVSTSANYIWSGTNTYNNNVFVNGTLNATLRFNSFLNPAARAAAITAPAVGLLTFIQQDAGGNTINRFEFWNGTAWTAYADPATTVTLSGTQTLTNKTISGATISGSTTLSGTVSNSATVSGGTYSAPTINSALIRSPSEGWNISATAVTSTTTVDYLTAQNWQYTTASTAGACTLNIRGNSTNTLSSILAVGQSVTFSFHVATGATTPAYFNAVQIDGTATGVSTRWQYGTAPSTGTVSGYDMYSVTVIRTAATPTYTVLASQSRW